MGKTLKNEKHVMVDYMASFISTAISQAIINTEYGNILPRHEGVVFEQSPITTGKKYGGCSI